MSYSPANDDIVGLPSGEVISNVSSKDLMILLRSNLVTWSPELEELVFDDINSIKIKKMVKTIKIGDFVERMTRAGKGEVIDIIENYDGVSKINNLNVDKIFSVGDTIYVIQFVNNKTGLYTIDQIRKI